MAEEHSCLPLGIPSCAQLNKIVLFCSQECGEEDEDPLYPTLARVYSWAKLNFLPQQFDLGEDGPTGDVDEVFAGHDAPEQVDPQRGRGIEPALAVEGARTEVIAKLRKKISPLNFKMLRSTSSEKPIHFSNNFDLD